MSPPKITGIHLVGSFPPDFKDTEEVIRTICSALPSGSMKRIPDGETGERHYFVNWQMRILAKKPIVLQQKIRENMGLGSELPPLSEEDKEKIIDEIEAEGGLDTEFDRAGLESYAEFVRLRENGIVPRGVKFQVGLPSPCSVVTCFIRYDMRALYEKVYERAILKAARNLMDRIPKEDLAIQWDCPMEFAILEEMAFYAGSSQKEFLSDVGAYWSGGDLEGVVERCVRLVDAVDEDVEIGLHLCYGNSQNRHFVEPKDMSWMVRVIDGVLGRAERNLDFLHMPVPIERTDEAYFEPLKALVNKLGDTELSLGLVHAHDLEGTRGRIQVAGGIVPSFSISGECGMGRTTRDVALNVLQIMAEVWPDSS